ncbi:DNA-3-methyladenine glycosylase family protein [Pseudofrankia inefficax]|uniref:DNA-3-methyladenine glycosylase II n=1 Tax=Pseudofrankia inefficax (strain DSM 45817 / CECT 9037 / DDB 130130 / EuI1c) TaxID=298654 RepID=E3IU15_PSEI1|nr:DNA-3-methyladenine glycosylase [Pseudofrankia inefficax]ADP81208.1 HhH-GPD family protein [Pseudofrankia inefficax]
MPTDDHTVATVELAEPVDIVGSLAAYGRHGDDLIDRWDGRVLIRTVPHGAGRAALATRPAGPVERPRLYVTGPPGLDTATLAGLARAQFLRDQPALDDLTARDPVIAAIPAHRRRLAQLTQTDVLHVLARCVTAQQVTGRFAATLRSRLVGLVGRPVTAGPHTAYALDADLLADTDPTRLTELGLSGRKAMALLGVARAVTGSLSLSSLHELDDEGVIATLTALPGIGRWSAEWFLIRALGRPLVAAGDLAVRKAVGHLYRPGLPPPAEEEVRLLTAHWGPAAALAQTIALDYHHEVTHPPRPARAAISA